MTGTTIKLLDNMLPKILDTGVKIIMKLVEGISKNIGKITETITKVVERPARRFTFGPSVGLGYGVLNKQADVFVGVTATWNVLR